MTTDTTPYHMRKSLDALGATMDAETNENLIAVAQVQATLAVADAIERQTRIAETTSRDILKALANLR